MIEFQSQLTKIKNIPMDSSKRSDNYFDSIQKHIRSEKFEPFNQYLNHRKPTRKMLNNFFHRKMYFYKIFREFSLRQTLSPISLNLKNSKKLRFRNFL